MRKNRKKIILFSVSSLIVLVSVYFITKTLSTEPIETTPIDMNEPTIPVDINEPDIPIDTNNPTTTTPLDTNEPVTPVEANEPTEIISEITFELINPEDIDLSEIDEYHRAGYYEGCELYYFCYNLEDIRLMKLVADNYDDFVAAYTDAMYEFIKDINWNTYQNPYKLGETVNISFIYRTILSSDDDGNYYIHIMDIIGEEYDIDISILSLFAGEKAIQKALELGASQHEIDFMLQSGYDIFIVNYTWDVRSEGNKPNIYIGMVGVDDWNPMGIGGFAHTKSEENIRNHDEETKWRLLTYEANVECKPAIFIGDLFQIPPEMRIIYFDDK